MRRYVPEIKLTAKKRKEVNGLIDHLTKIMNYKSDLAGPDTQIDVKIAKGEVKPFQLKYARATQPFGQALDYELKMTRSRLASLRTR
jgi:hypothetical protein